MQAMQSSTELLDEVRQVMELLCIDGPDTEPLRTVLKQARVTKLYACLLRALTNEQADAKTLRSKLHA